MPAKSTLQQITELNRSILNLLARQDLDALDRAQQQLITEFKRELIDARLDVRDYEMADSRAEMHNNGTSAVKRLNRARHDILKASEHGLFSPVEIAEVTVEIEQIIGEINESLK